MIKRILLCILNLLAITQFAVSQVDDTTYQQVEEVTIQAEKEKRMVFEDPKYYIVDFAIRDTNALLLMKNFGTYYLYELDRSMNFRYKLELKFNANSLYTDCFQNTYVVSMDSVYFVYADVFGLFLTEEYKKAGFMTSMEKCVGVTSQKILFEKNWLHDSLGEVFYSVDRVNGDRNVVYTMKDSELSRKMRKRAARLNKIGALNKDLLVMGNGEEGVRKALDLLEEDADSLRREREDFSAATFGYFGVRKVKYNSLFTLNDTIYIFNHYDCRLDILNQAGEIVRTVPITYHLKKYWDDEIHLDRVKKEFYAVYMLNGVQHLLRLGITEDSQDSISKITKHAYPEKVLVRNGYAYYTYKPNVDANLNKLYMQRL
ncbi:MAG: hypothetical protein AB8B56_03180 [Crocinitomicaceae bacterium]